MQRPFGVTRSNVRTPERVERRLTSLVLSVEFGAGVEVVTGVSCDAVYGDDLVRC